MTAHVDLALAFWAGCLALWAARGRLRRKLLSRAARLRLVQHLTDPRRSFPDPDAPFTVVPAGQDFGQGGTGCLATLLGAAAFLAPAVGLLVLVGG